MIYIQGWDLPEDEIGVVLLLHLVICVPTIVLFKMHIYFISTLIVTFEKVHYI